MTEDHTGSDARKRFIERFGGVVEHAPWVAEEVWGQYPEVATADESQDLSEAFGRVIRAAPRERQLELLRAHPDLACGLAAPGSLTGDSLAEQQGAGLDQCSPDEFLEFQSLNLEYKATFGFPFIIAVKGLDRKEILNRFRDRIERSPGEEFSTAIENVIRIVGFRIAQKLEQHG
ncbi:MAG: 2-oxo-4-hydroxy-4-carboxy-5-ureidoimidazoline decarboxylase [Xanthomonadales bacterium]|nr:2-oxo-4-hydroxy-4-carboxy-5-ureidoimidazoline decarboxylase [Xanthomonadales bacterium]